MRILFKAILHVMLSIFSFFPNPSGVIPKASRTLGGQISSFVAVPNYLAGDSSSTKIAWLENVAVIDNGSIIDTNNHFLIISSLCIDSDNNLFVADSGHHKIFMFNSRGNLLKVFGSRGRGPGEFVGNMLISYGNDGNIYVTDDAIWRLSIFNDKGEFLRQFQIGRFLRDEAQANLRGDVYLLSPSGMKLIDCYSPGMKLEKSILENDKYVDFPYQKPPKAVFMRIIHYPSINEVKKLLTKDGQLIVVIVSNQKVVLLDNELEPSANFTVDNAIFVSDYKRRLKETIADGGWINAFGSVFLNHKNSLCFCYYNESLGIPEIYRYSLKGSLIDILRVHDVTDQTNSLIIRCDGLGNYYSISLDRNKVLVYREAT